MSASLPAFIFCVLLWCKLAHLFVHFAARLLNRTVHCRQADPQSSSPKQKEQDSPSLHLSATVQPSPLIHENALSKALDHPPHNIVIASSQEQQTSDALSKNAHNTSTSVNNLMIEILSPLDAAPSNHFSRNCVPPSTALNLPSKSTGQCTGIAALRNSFPCVSSSLPLLPSSVCYFYMHNTIYISVSLQLHAVAEFRVENVPHEIVLTKRKKLIFWDPIVYLMTLCMGQILSPLALPVLHAQAT